MDNGWEYLQQFTLGVLEAAGRKNTLKHVMVKLQKDAGKKLLDCFIDGTAEPEMIRDLPIKSEFLVRIKCVDKEAGIYLTTKGKACVKQVGHGPEGLQVHLEVKPSRIAVYQKQTDEKGIDFLQPVYNDLTSREDKKAKVIATYDHR